MLSNILNSLGLEVRTPVVEPTAPEPVVLPEPYLRFECTTCKQVVELMERLEPGQAAVLNCENCGASWSVFQPSLQVYPTNKFEPVWKHTSGDVKSEDK